MTSAELYSTDVEMRGDGKKPFYISGYENANSIVQYSAIWYRLTAVTGYMHYDLDYEEYESLFALRTTTGYFAKHVDCFTTQLGVVFAAIFHLGNVTQVSRYDQSLGAYDSTFSEMTGRGFRLSSLATAGGQQTTWLSVWTQHDGAKSNSYAWSARRLMRFDVFPDYLNEMVSSDLSPLAISVDIDQRSGSAFLATLFSDEVSTTQYGNRAYQYSDRVSGDYIYEFGTHKTLYQGRINELQEGYFPRVVDFYRDGGQEHVLHVWERNSFGSPCQCLQNVSPWSPSSTPGPFNLGNKNDCVDQRMTKFMRDNKIPGLSLTIARAGSFVYQQAYGVRHAPCIANSERDGGISVYAPFRVASLSQPITGLLIQILVKSGQINLSNRIFATSSGYLSNFVNFPRPCCPVSDLQGFLSTITVDHLLSHSAGWDPVQSGDPMFKSQEIARVMGLSTSPSCEDIIYYQISQPIDFEPGTRTVFSNFAFCLLGKVIEQVTGMNYTSAAREFLLRPAGTMANWVIEDSMYPGSSLLDGTRVMDASRTGEVEYWRAGCPSIASAFPPYNDTSTVPYGGFNLGAMEASAGWVATPDALVQLMLLAYGEGCICEECLIDPTVASRLGFYHSSDDRLTHAGSLPGSQSLLMRTAGGLIVAAVANRRVYHDNFEEVMNEAVACVDEWSSEGGTDQCRPPPTPVTPESSSAGGAQSTRDSSPSEASFSSSRVAVSSTSASSLVSSDSDSTVVILASAIGIVTSLLIVLFAYHFLVRRPKLEKKSHQPIELDSKNKSEKRLSTSQPPTAIISGSDVPGRRRRSRAGSSAVSRSRSGSKTASRSRSSSLRPKSKRNSVLVGQYASTAPVAESASVDNSDIGTVVEEVYLAAPAASSGQPIAGEVPGYTRAREGAAAAEPQTVYAAAPSLVVPEESGGEYHAFPGHTYADAPKVNPMKPTVAPSSASTGFDPPVVANPASSQYTQLETSSQYQAGSNYNQSQYQAGSSYNDQSQYLSGREQLRSD